MENEELSDYELLRLKNLEENRRMLIELGLISNTPEPVKKPEKNERKPLKRRSSLTNKMKQPLERRQSARLKKDYDNPYRFVSSDVFHVIIGGDNENAAKNQNVDYLYGSEEDDSDEENKRARKKSHRTHSMERMFIAVEDITEKHIKNIAVHVRDKVYSAEGTTCHQCRQKTLDQKTVCRSSKCYGVRGQFCGPCLKNRYGEEVAQALKDPEWTCPPCRDQCNCSICRTQAGKMPTGQLTNLALQQGFNSVQHFLVENEKD